MSTLPTPKISPKAAAADASDSLQLVIREAADALRRARSDRDANFKKLLELDGAADLARLIAGQALMSLNEDLRDMERDRQAMRRLVRRRSVLMAMLQWLKEEHRLAAQRRDQRHIEFMEVLNEMWEETHRQILAYQALAPRRLDFHETLINASRASVTYNLAEQALLDLVAAFDEPESKVAAGQPQTQPTDQPNMPNVDPEDCDTEDGDGGYSRERD